jgi:uncharacterized protein
MINKKYSRYNLDMPVDGKILLYNSVTDNFLLLENLLFELLTAARNENYIVGIHDYHPDFYKELCDKGFIIDEDFNEYLSVRDKIISTDNGTEEFNIIINPTMNCNFKCWYCYEEHIKGSKMTKSTIDKVFALIHNVILRDRVKSLYLGWFGGEPLLYYEQVMLPILKYASEICEQNNVIFESDITTNGFLLRPEMLPIFKKYNLNFFQITLDGNRDKHNKVRFVNEKRGSYDEIIQNIKLLTLNNFIVNLRINFTDDTLKGLEEIIYDLKDCDSEFLTIDMHQVWQTKNDNDRIHNKEFENKIKEIKDEFRESDLKVASNDVSYITNSCYADKHNEVVVNYNGDIYKCTARDFTKENSLGYIDTDGNLIWNQQKYDKRQSAKLSNKPCQECPILPICGSGCSEYAYNYDGEDYCVYNFDINKKKELVLDHFYESLQKNAV